jgi:hypothetical protein
LLPFSDSDRASFQWMLSLLRGLQLFAEGHLKFLQEYMRGYRPHGSPSVNFVAQMSQELTLVHRHIEYGHLTLLDLLLNSSLCFLAGPGRTGCASLSSTWPPSPKSAKGTRAISRYGLCMCG